MPTNPVMNRIMTNCSGAAIATAFERVVKNHIPSNRWVGDKNYYIRKTKERMNVETPTTLRKNQIGEYVAASVVIHSSDGWNYVSRSVESLINGDIPSAIHFAYYAELRSAMSLMAYQGVGIFDKKHIWFDSAKAPTLFGGFHTHSAADIGLTELSNLSAKKDIIFGLLKVKNHSLSNWIRETGFSATTKYSSSLISRWLSTWSIDLHLNQDQGLRNEMSYRPHFSSHAVDIQTTIDKLIQVWNLLEPTERDQFPLLDQHLLRLTLEGVYKRSRGNNPIGADYERYITNIFGRLGEETTQSLFEFLLRRREPQDHILFEEAKKDSDPEVNKKDPFPMICRAMLMLRLSTAAAHQLIEGSSVDVNSLKFWWERLALQHGLTPAMPYGYGGASLYADVRESINEITGIGMACIKDAFSSSSNPLFNLKQFERPGIWGLGL